MYLNLSNNPVENYFPSLHLTNLPHLTFQEYYKYYLYREEYNQSMKFTLKIISTLLKSMSNHFSSEKIIKYLSAVPDLIKNLPLLSLYSPYNSTDNEIQNVTNNFINNLIFLITKSEISVDDKIFYIQILIELAIKRGELSIILRIIKLINKIGYENIELPLHIKLTEQLKDLTNANHTNLDIFSQNDTLNCQIMVFGKSDQGSLGIENETMIMTPTVITKLKDKYIRKISSFSTHCLAVSSNGDIYTWGNGDKYRLGHGNTDNQYIPKIIECIVIL